MLAYGREPLSPLDAWCNELQGDKMNSHNVYLESLSRKQTELYEIAKDNSFNSLEKARKRRNKVKVESKTAVGDLVFLKIHARKELVPRFDEPYLVLDRKNSDLKLWFPHRDKWGHIAHCKWNEHNSLDVHYNWRNRAQCCPKYPTRATNPTVSQDSIPNEVEPSSTSAATEYDEPNDLEDREASELVPERRYPRRETRPPQYLTDYTEWDELPYECNRRRPHSN